MPKRGGDNTDPLSLFEMVGFFFVINRSTGVVMSLAIKYDINLFVVTEIYSFTVCLLSPANHYHSLK